MMDSASMQKSLVSGIAFGAYRNFSRGRDMSGALKDGAFMALSSLGARYLEAQPFVANILPMQYNWLAGPALAAFAVNYMVDDTGDEALMKYGAPALSHIIGEYYGMGSMAPSTLPNRPAY